jgi:hypothetical protein
LRTGLPHREKEEMRIPPYIASLVLSFSSGDAFLLLKYIPHRGKRGKENTT